MLSVSVHGAYHHMLLHGYTLWPHATLDMSYKEVLMPFAVREPLEVSRAAAFSPRLRLPLPVLRREGIRWTGGRDRPLRIELAFENPDRLPSAPTEARIEIALFGAFVATKPLSLARVPSVPPGGRLTVSTTIQKATIQKSIDPATPAFGALKGKFPLLSWLGSLSSPHFVGNLNVFVTHGAPVERHLERTVGLRPGHANYALFFVGNGRRDVYTFSLGASEPGWRAELSGLSWDSPVPICVQEIGLSITPPARAKSGCLSVLVKRESTRETVPVEFELEAGASRAKWYFF